MTTGTPRRVGQGVIGVIVGVIETTVGAVGVDVQADHPGLRQGVLGPAHPGHASMRCHRPQTAEAPGVAPGQEVGLFVGGGHIGEGESRLVGLGVGSRHDNRGDAHLVHPGHHVVGTR